MWLWTQTLLMNEDSSKQQYKMHKKSALLYSVQVQECFDYILEFVILMTKEIIPQVNFIHFYSIKVL